MGMEIDKIKLQLLLVIETFSDIYAKPSVIYMQQKIQYGPSNIYGPFIYLMGN